MHTKITNGLAKLDVSRNMAFAQPSPDLANLALFYIVFGYIILPMYNVIYLSSSKDLFKKK
jgi:hypothetical protein